METLKEYLKALKWYWMFIFLAIYTLGQGVQVLSSFWLSDWSNKADEENNIPHLRNKRLLVYAAFGVSQSIVISLFIINEY